MTDRTPLAIVDRDGLVWPWDGRETNEKLIEAGSRYVYDQGELTRLLKKVAKQDLSEEAARKKRGVNPGKKPVAPDSPGSAKDVKSAVMQDL